VNTVLKWFFEALLGLLVIWTACEGSRASGITDPAMRVLDDDFSSAIGPGTVFAPNATGGGVFGFFNATGSIITEMTFETSVAPNLTQDVIIAAFVCNQGNFNPFFEFCSVNYGKTGRLDIAFWGTNPLTGTEGNSSLAGQQKGVPSVLPGCNVTPDVPGCTGVGHFAVSLNDSFSQSATTGGWSFERNPELFNPGGPTFTVAEIETSFGALPGDSANVPEPATVTLMGSALLGFFVLRKRRRLRAAAPGPESRS
jgi:hypothetical protein